jgi:hypothetical protein
MLNKFLGLFPYLYRFIIPATGLRTPTPAETTYDNAAGHFVQMDLIVCMIAVWVAGLWDLALRKPQKFANPKFIGLSVVSLFFGSLFLGAGSATAALWSYREAVMKGDRDTQQNLTVAKHAAPVSK